MGRGTSSWSSSSSKLSIFRNHPKHAHQPPNAEYPDTVRTDRLTFAYTGLCVVSNSVSSRVPMLSKRSRATYESDLHETPFVLFGTPIGDSRGGDDGSYIPLHKQEVRDERGRRRLHGAFTGGWSAGYFNTVGSKEGWTPSAFVSSRQRLVPDKRSENIGQRPEDFMDDEDLADLAETQKIQTTDSFAGLGSSHLPSQRNGGLALFTGSSGHTMGFTLLERMGWRHGQGIGHKVRRAARLDDGQARNNNPNRADTHMFAPDDVATLKITRKLDRHGLGGESSSAADYQGVGNSDALTAAARVTGDAGHSLNHLPLLPVCRKKSARVRGGGLKFATPEGIHSDSDDDPFAMGPRISFARSPGGAKPRKGKTTANPAFTSKLTFTSRQTMAQSALIEICRDGRAPLPGFTLSAEEEDDGTIIPDTYAPPAVPLCWATTKRRQGKHGLGPGAEVISVQKPAHDPKTRAAALGETLLPGKSVFDFMSAESRARIALVSGNPNLPQAKGEVPLGHAVSDAGRIREGLEGLPRLERETAVAALSRGNDSRGPYAEDEAKQARYRAYLEHVAFGSAIPQKSENTAAEDYVKEIAEFHTCANLFKPMSGIMATRFTVSSSSRTSSAPASAASGNMDILTQQEDSSQTAAKVGMYGKLTRSVVDFHPTRLLCKRFNVRPPINDNKDEDISNHNNKKNDNNNNNNGSSSNSSNHDKSRIISVGEGVPHASHNGDRQHQVSEATPTGQSRPAYACNPNQEMPSCDSIRNRRSTSVRSQETPTGLQRPAEDVFKAIFGDSSDEEGSP